MAFVVDVFTADDGVDLAVECFVGVVTGDVLAELVASGLTLTRLAPPPPEQAPATTTKATNPHVTNALRLPERCMDAAYARLCDRALESRALAFIRRERGAHE